MARFELNQENVEQVVGGAFNFFYDGGVKKCYVNETDTIYYAAPDANDKLILLLQETRDQGLTAEETVQMAIDRGIIWY